MFHPQHRTHYQVFKTRPHHFRPVGSGSIPTDRYISKSVPQTTQEAYVAKHVFADFAIDVRLKNNVISHGYTVPTPIQDQTISEILTGRDVVGVANTGSGKTAAFLLPLINKILQNRTEKVLIIAPTRELAMQINDELKIFAKSLNVSSVICIGGAGIGPQVSGLRQNPNVIIGTPGRLMDLSKKGILNLIQIHSVVLDEVDRMLDIGFIRDIRYLLSFLPKNRQSLFFSATVSPEVASLIRSFSQNPFTVSVKTNETAAGIDQDVIHAKNGQEKIDKLKELLWQEEFKKVLIFGRTKWGVEKLSNTLLESGFSVAAIHGNKSQGQRLRALSQFKQNQLKILVATDVAARGLDIEDVSHVINFDEPASYTDYVHRIGRTGRANKSGKALTFVF